jgi:hypothetical protein
MQLFDVARQAMRNSATNPDIREQIGPTVLGSVGGI